MLHTKFRSMVSEIFEGFLPFMGMVAILVVTSIISINFHFHVPKCLHTKFG